MAMQIYVFIQKEPGNLWSYESFSDMIYVRRYISQIKSLYSDRNLKIKIVKLPI